MIEAAQFPSLEDGRFFSRPSVYEFLALALHALLFEHTRDINPARLQSGSPRWLHDFRPRGRRLTSG
jgi:hypothetical protein